MILLMQLSLLCKTSKSISVMQQHHLELQLNNIIGHKKEKQNISQGEFFHYRNYWYVSFKHHCKNPDLVGRTSHQYMYQW